MQRTRSRLTILALLGLGLCGVGYRVVHTADEVPGSGAIAAAARPLEGAATPEAAALAELRRDLAQLELRVRIHDRKPTAAAPAGAEAPGPAAIEDPHVEAEARAEEERGRRAHVAGIDTAFRGEATDPRWSSAASSVIRTAIAGDDDLRPLVRGAECRSSTCRVELADDGSGTLDRALTMFVLQVGHALPRVVVDRPADVGGRATMVLYLSAGT